MVFIAAGAAAGGYQLASDPSLGCYPVAVTNVDEPLDTPKGSRFYGIYLPLFWQLPFRADCSTCSNGYTAQLGFTCSNCSENSAGGIAVAVVLAVVALFVAAAVVSYVMSGEAGLGAGRGVIERLTRHLPLQFVKLVIVAWQILTQVSGI